MKVLKIDGADYANVLFEDSSYSPEGVIVMMGENKSIDLDLGDEVVECTLYDFEGVILTDEFIGFIKGIQDYDDSKHNGFYFIK